MGAGVAGNGTGEGSAISASILRVTSGSAGAPFAIENLIPLYSAGLCEAVKLIPPLASRRRISKATVGVGTVSCER